MPRSVGGTVVVNMRINSGLLRSLDELVRTGRYPSRGEAIRIAVRDLLISYRRKQGLKPRRLTSEFTEASQ